jgi:hypothetical protein
LYEKLLITLFSIQTKNTKKKNMRKTSGDVTEQPRPDKGRLSTNAARYRAQ